MRVVYIVQQGVVVQQRQREQNGFYNLLLSNLLTVPASAGETNFSVRRSNMRRGAKNTHEYH